MDQQSFNSDENRLYAVYDVRAAAYTDLFGARNDQLAIRHVLTKAMQPSHPWHLFPGEFTLFFAGTWSSYNLGFSQHVPESLGTILQLLATLERTLNNEAT